MKATDKITITLTAKTLIEVWKIMDHHPYSKTWLELDDVMTKIFGPYPEDYQFDES